MRRLQPMAIVTLRAVEYAAYPEESPLFGVSLAELLSEDVVKVVKFPTGIHVVRDEGSTVVIPEDAFRPQSWMN